MLNLEIFNVFEKVSENKVKLCISRILKTDVEVTRVSMVEYYRCKDNGCVENIGWVTDTCDGSKYVLWYNYFNNTTHIS